MAETGEFSLGGGCTCRTVRYVMTRGPLIVHACHCTWCQRETGTAFATNALVETENIQLIQGAPETVHTPSASGKGQMIVRCPQCKIALWSHYAASGPVIGFIRAGTTDEPARLPPDIHIYTSTKQPWVILPEGVPAVPEFYDVRDVWPAASLARARAARKG